MKHLLYFSVGAFIVYMCTRFAYMVPSFLHYPGYETWPFLLRWFVGFLSVIFTGLVLYGTYRIGEEAVENLN